MTKSDLFSVYILNFPVESYPVQWYLLKNYNFHENNEKYQIIQ